MHDQKLTAVAQHFHLADEIIILGNSKIETRGAWDELKHISSQITKMSLSEAEGTKDIDRKQDDVKLVTKQRQIEDVAIDLSRKTGDSALYGYYIRSVGAKNFVFMTGCTLSYSFFVTFAQYWLKLWTESNLSEAWFYAVGYLLVALIPWMGTNGQAWSMHLRIAPRSGAVLHDRLLTAIIGAPLSYYSDNDIGVMLNRFGQDISLVDKDLPGASTTLVTQICKLTMQIIFLFIVQKALILTLPLCATMVYFVQRIYLRTSRQLRFIELESRSAVYSSFLETVEGIATIRAFGWQDKYEADNFRQLDKSQGPLYLLLCLQRWLNVVLDLLIAGVAATVICLAVYYNGTTTGAQVGVALNLILVANTTLLRLVESWTSLEISLGAIARLKAVATETPKEDKLWENLIPPANWPSSGTVELRNISASYK